MRERLKRYSYPWSRQCAVYSSNFLEGMQGFWTCLFPIKSVLNVLFFLARLHFLIVAGWKAILVYLGLLLTSGPNAISWASRHSATRMTRWAASASKLKAACRGNACHVIRNILSIHLWRKGYADFLESTFSHDNLAILHKPSSRQNKHSSLIHTNFNLRTHWYFTIDDMSYLCAVHVMPSSTSCAAEAAVAPMLRSTTVLSRMEVANQATRVALEIPGGALKRCTYEKGA